MNPIAVPYSGGMDSFISYLNLCDSDTIKGASLFFFKHRLTLPIEEKLAREKGATIVEAFDFRALSKAPDPMIPFRNYFFAQYLIGLGFREIMFSFTREDTFSDTSVEFLKDVERMGIKGMGAHVIATSPFILSSKIDAVKYVLSLKHKQFTDELLRTHSCSLYPACRACLKCLIREIALRMNALCEGISDKHWTDHWGKEPSLSVIRDFHIGRMTGKFPNVIFEPYFWYLRNKGLGEKVLKF